MGAHSFDHEPEHCDAYRANVGPNLPRLYGLTERWNMPTARHRRALGAGMDFKGVDHYVLTYHVGGASARRGDGPPRATAYQGALSLQRPGSAGRFSSDGVVEYAHFYFLQSLLCEVADEAGLGHAAEPDDFFALKDPTLAVDVETYLRRATASTNPPTGMEMDGRSYLIALGLLRAVLNRQDLLASSTENVERVDLRKVLAMIEDQIAEPLRLTDLSGLIDMSPFHFSRVFKEHVGEPPAQYLQRRRTERAVELIRSTNIPLSSIAFQTGFSSQSHMTRAVKQATGMPPGRLRSEK
ncbi:MAG: AraC family transcriptional regulator [Pseudomonadota bacterium]